MPVTQCKLCKKSVYPVDPQVNLDGSIFHRGCARCSDCNCNITISNFRKTETADQLILLCKTHYFERYHKEGNFVGADKFSKSPMRGVDPMLLNSKVSVEAAQRLVLKRSSNNLHGEPDGTTTPLRSVGSQHSMLDESMEGGSLLPPATPPPGAELMSEDVEQATETPLLPVPSPEAIVDAASEPAEVVPESHSTQVEAAEANGQDAAEKTDDVQEGPAVHSSTPTEPSTPPPADFAHLVAQVEAVSMKGVSSEGERKDSSEDNTIDDSSSILSLPNGDTYRGGLRDGKMHGYGVYTVKGGNEYVGSFVDGQMEGQGVLTYANGDRYEGGYVRNKKSGQGRFTFASGMVFEGSYLDGLEHGPGRVRYANGDTYEGMLERGTRSHGTMRYANGDVYTGAWHERKRHGRGSITLSRDGSVQEGEWVNDQFLPK